MTITKELLESKLADLSKQREEAVARLNAIAGAEAAVRVILTDLEAEAIPEPQS